MLYKCMMLDFKEKVKVIGKYGYSLLSDLKIPHLSFFSSDIFMLLVVYNLR